MVMPADYVTVVALTQDLRVVLVEQYRPAAERVTLELPSGLVDPGEAPEVTARRELFEETGFEVEELFSLGALIPDTGRLGNRLHCFFARVKESVRPRPKNNEGIEVRIVTLETVKSAINDGTFDHALHCGVWMLAISKGFVPA